MLSFCSPFLCEDMLFHFTYGSSKGVVIRFLLTGHKHDGAVNGLLELGHLLQLDPTVNELS